MKILRATTEAQDILFTPRINASVVSLRIRGDADASDVVLPNVLTSIRNGYHVVCVVVDLQENNYYSLDVTFKDELIYRDRIFVTNQDLNKFSQDVGNRDTYTYYTDNTPIQNNNNRLLTSLCSSIMADNGIYEPCENDINMSIDLNGLTVFLNPRGYKEGVLYNTLPYNNIGNFTYARSGTVTRVNPSGNVETLTANVPQLDNSSGCPSLLLEPERTNLLRFSNDFSNPLWYAFTEGGASYAILTPNVAVSPDGTINASRVQFDRGASGASWFRQTAPIFFVGSSSIWMRSNTGSNQMINIRNAATVQQFEVTTEWQRFTYTDAGTSFRMQFGLSNHITTDQTADILIFGAQCEEGSFATSYIPTTSLVVTRGASLVTGAGDVNTFNSSEGVIAFKGESLVSDNEGFKTISISDNSSNNRIFVGYSDVNNTIQASYTSSGVQVHVTATTNIVSNAIIAVKYTKTALELWLNGVRVDTAPIINTLPVNTLSSMRLDSGVGNSRFEGIINWIAYYNVLKTDEEMANLTSL